MTSKDLIEACDILLELEKEFAGEESKLADISNERYIKIEEIDHQILTLRRNEDVDFRVFSPRNTSTVNSEKIKNLEDDKKNLEREKKDADRQLSYYSGKTEKINKVIKLLRGELGDDSREDNLTVKNSRNPFGFLEAIIEENENLEKSRSESSNVSDETEVKTDDFESNEKIVLEDAEESPISKLINERIKEDLSLLSEEDKVSELKEEKDDSETSDIVIDSSPIIEVQGIPVDEVERICHKVEFSAKIISNDHVRAKMELKEIISEFKDIIRAYSK